MTALPLNHMRQRGVDAIEHPFRLTSIMRSKSSTLPNSSKECGIRPALLRMTSGRPRNVKVRR